MILYKAALLYITNDSNLEMIFEKCGMQDSGEQLHSLDWKDKYMFVCCQIIHQCNATLQFIFLVWQCVHNKNLYNSALSILGVCDLCLL